MTVWIHLAAVGLTSLPLLGGCAQIGQRPAVHQDRIVRSEIIEVSIDGAHAEVIHEGTTVHLTVARMCDVRRENVVDRTSTSKSFNQSLGQTWFLAGTALVSVGAGTALVIDSASTYSNDHTSRTYNPTGPGKEKVYGFGLIGAGVVLGTVALVDAIRATGANVERSQITQNAGIVRRAVVCTDRPAANVAITGALGDQTVTLGKTDSQGKLHADLDQALPETTILAKSATKLTLQADGQECATINLAPLYLRREGRAYEASGLEVCAKPTTPNSCRGVESFLRDYPDGPHSQAARQTLNSTRTTIAQLTEDAIWAKIPLAECIKSGAEDPAEVHAACDPLRQYLARYTEGRHAEEARKALETGDAREKHLAAAVLRREKANQTKEAADERKRCVAVCRVGCSGWRISDHAGCFSGCVESRCSGNEQ